MIKILFLLTISHASWVTLSKQTPHPVYSDDLDAHPPSFTKAAMFCPNENVYLLFGDEMWKFQNKQWLWLPSVTPFFNHIQAYWTLNNDLYVLQDQLYSYSFATRQWNRIAMGANLSEFNVFWSNAEEQSLYLYSLHEFIKFDVTTQTWVTIMKNIHQPNQPIVGCENVVLVNGTLRQWSSSIGWTALPLKESQNFTKLWCFDEYVQGLSKSGEMYQISLNTGATSSMGKQGFVNRLDYTSCSDTMKVFGGAHGYNDLLRFGESHTSLLDFEPIIIISSTTLALSSISFIILTILSVIITCQQCRKRHAPFVANVDYL